MQEETHPFQNKRNIFFLLGVFFIIVFVAFTTKFGVSNNDEFLALVGIRNADTAYCFDAINILKYINYLFFSEVTLYNFRLSKVFFNVLNFILFAYLLYKIFLKKSDYYLKNFKTILLFILFSFLSFQFNRAIHYNDILDTETIVVMLMAIHIYLYPNSKINYFLILLNGVFAALLFITKFPLGLISIFTLCCMIWYMNANKFLKIGFTLLHVSIFLLLVISYFKHTYGSIDATLENYRFFKTFFTKDKFYVYSIDIFIVLFLVVLSLIFNLKAKFFKSYFTKKIIILFFILFLVAELLLFVFSLQSRSAYVLYYMLFDAVLFSITIGIITSVYYHLFKNKSYKRILLFTYYFLFIFLCFWGSMTLQLVNIALHPIIYTFTILVGLFLLNREHLVKYFVCLAATFFIFCSILNPYLYNNHSIFSMNTKCSFPENETFYIDKASATYYNNIKEFLQPYKRYPIVDFDFLNVLYFSEIAPFLEPNFVDDQPSEISCNQLRYFKELGKGTIYPKLTISSSPIDSNFYKCLDNYYKIELGNVVYSDYDPTSGYFKKMNSNDSVYIHQIITTNSRDF